MTTLNRPRTCGEDMPTVFPKCDKHIRTDFGESAARRSFYLRAVFRECPRLTQSGHRGLSLLAWRIFLRFVSHCVAGTMRKTRPDLLSVSK